jgi:glucan phosphoethanolaminetransferase (alkaline phosphatase superfamily)
MKSFVELSVNLLMAAAIAAGALFVVVFNLACWMNSVNYSGLDIPFWVRLFEGGSLAGVVIFLAALALKLSGIRKGLAAILVAVSVFAALNAYLYRANNVMMDYDDWLVQGEPVRPSPLEKKFWAPLLP